MIPQQTVDQVTSSLLLQHGQGHPPVPEPAPARRAVPGVRSHGSLVKMAHVPRQGLEIRRIDRREDRQDIVTDPVAEKGGIGIGPVFTERNALPGRIRGNFRPAEREHRPDQRTAARQAAHRPHAADPFQPGSTEQIEKQRLRIVIRMMGDRDGSLSPGNAFPVKPGVAKIAGRHFNADAPRSGMRRRIKALRPERDVPQTAPKLHQIPVRIALRTAKGEIAVQHFKRPARPVEQVRHAHRIHSAADGKKDRPVRRAGQSFQNCGESLQHGGRPYYFFEEKV